MVSARRALLPLTFAVALMATTPALSQATGMGFPGFTSPLQCWKIIEGVEGCTEQLLKSLAEQKLKFLPDCCKAIIGLPLTCAQWIFPLGLSLGDQVNKFCTNLLGAAPPRAS